MREHKDGFNVVVVDDEIDILILINRVLEFAGYMNVFCFQSLQEVENALNITAVEKSIVEEEIDQPMSCRYRRKPFEVNDIQKCAGEMMIETEVVRTNNKMDSFIDEMKNLSQAINTVVNTTKDITCQ